ncbi:MAG: SPASM domain-containing protein, partial [Candidatus Aenigmarchaeota archaeon]|nr:SPASM domain-containing protein [Candidatus Aenigmarchaeota archaeon]
MDQMKASRYNLFVNHENRPTIVYNTFSGAIARGNENFVTALREGNIDLLEDSGISDALSRQGILVPDNFDEFQKYRDIHNRWKSGSELAEFNMLITYDCNFACPYCYEGRGETGQKIHGYRSMSPEMIETFKRFVKRTVNDRGSKAMELVLYGGEPMLMENECKKTTDELANWAEKSNVDFSLHMLSNGSLISRDFIRWANDYGMRLQVPVDGDRDQHNKIRFYKDDKSGSFDGITDGVLSYTAGTDVETHIRISLTDETYPTMENMLDQLAGKGLTHIYPDFCYITAFTEACDAYKTHVIPDSKLFKVMPKLWREAHKRGFPLEIRPFPQALPCSSVADGSYIVDPFGKVYKCWELVGLDEHVVGNLNPDGSMEKTSVYADVLERDPTRIEKCASHIYLPSCAGGCVCKASWQHGTYHASGCGTENFLIPDKLRVFTETNEPLKNPVLGDGKIEM